MNTVNHSWIFILHLLDSFHKYLELINLYIAKINTWMSKFGNLINGIVLDIDADIKCSKRCKKCKTRQYVYI
jgi:hypothetical protein